MPDEFEMNIDRYGISVRTRKLRRMKDQDTGEVLEMPDKPHRAAVGIADFGGDVKAFAKRVAELVEPHFGKEGAALIGRTAAAEAERDLAKQAASDATDAAATISAERDDLKAKLDEAMAAKVKSDVARVKP